MKIAIDGPAGAGKSTIAKRLAQELGIIYIDTGAMYRALSLTSLQQGIDLEDPKALSQLASQINIRFEQDINGQKIICNEQNVTKLIRSPEVSSCVSLVSSYSEVREVMVEKQRKMAQSVSVVMEGRDIGECVLPDADYKIFLNANLAERAKRRFQDLSDLGYETDLLTVMQQLSERDRIDSQRQMGALKILQDSIVVDTSNLSIDEVLNLILQLIKER